MGDGPTIRDAATVIAIRDRTTVPRVLMGQRGAQAVFMPMKFVFPGGAVDPGDAAIPLPPLAEPCATRLASNSPPDMAPALAAAAIREFWEETGLLLGTPGDWPDAPDDWRDFAATGHRPDPSGLSFIFRAVTPPGRPRRFDARFFLIEAETAIASDPDDFSADSDELSHLQWIPLSEIRRFDLPFITEIVLAEVAARLDNPGPHHKMR